MLNCKCERYDLEIRLSHYADYTLASIVCKKCGALHESSKIIKDNSDKRHNREFNYKFERKQRLK